MPRPTVAAVAVVLFGAVAVFLLVGRSESDAPGDDARLTTAVPTAEPNGVVEYIVDGDTIDVSIDGVTDLLPLGTAVRVERDTVGRDDYGRLLGYVYRADDALFVNAELVRLGYAQPLTIPPNTVHEPTFVDAARQAEAADAGLWAAC